MKKEIQDLDKYISNDSYYDVRDYNKKLHPRSKTNANFHEFDKDTVNDYDTDKYDMSRLAINVSDRFYKTPLWMAQQQEDGTYRVVKSRLTKKQYDNAKKKLSGLNNKGREKD